MKILSKRRVLLTISYDGTNYCGWQKQLAGAVPTVQEALDKACSRLFKADIQSIGASRTDAGVHALGQRAVIDVDTTIPTDRIPMALNGFLPEDIVVTAAQDVSDDFNPRFNAVKKTYEYKIYNSHIRNPMYRNCSEYVREYLDVKEMDSAARAFIGEHDFKGFCSTGSSSKTTVRTIYSISVEQKNDFIVIRVTGSGFLYNMVRIIAGTLIYVGNGKIKSYEMKGIISSCDRRKAGKTAGPSGLTLVKIMYDYLQQTLDTCGAV
ncbi:tRNA pseudouridine synthase A [bioreactor metagenome]|uniref:tRNA pseudouridine synthase A n=1 Tax=bioreactor metagenome TaxID=1076179 RepID=A0A645ARR7_9ZZZZ|nr:tRNA pseudouridine(38-40) synthase TruA [Candidatus Metalachnospira sp.]